MYMIKKCSKCKKMLDVEQFSKNQHYCKICRSEYIKEHRKQINETNKLYYYRNKQKLNDEAKYRIFLRRTKFYKQIIASSVCSVCKTKNDLCLHHIDGNITNNSLDNLKVICRTCHSKLHTILKNKKTGGN